MTEQTAIKLGPREHGTIGVVHCGVTREGCIAVGGAPRDIADGQEIVFEHIGIKARRLGSEYSFAPVNP